MRAFTSVVAAVTLGLFTLSTQAIAQDKGPSASRCRPSPRPAGSPTATTWSRYFKEQGYETDLQYADDDIPNQLAQIENMVTKGVKVLVIAAIDGTTLSDVAAAGADSGVKVIAYDRLIRGSKNVDYYATFDNFQVGVLQARLDRRQARPEGRQGPVQHRAVRRLAGRQQRLLLLRRRDVGAPALHRQQEAGGAQQADGHGQGRHPALGRRGGAGPHGQPAVSAYYRQEGATRCCRRTTACRSASSRR